MDIRTGPTTTPNHNFLVAFSLYAFWCALAALSDFLGQTTLPQQSAVVLMAGIAATSLMFFGLARAGTAHRPPETTITLAQCIFAVAWATLYNFMATGPGELVLGINITIFLFASARIGPRALTQLAIFAASSYGLILSIKAALAWAETPVWPQLIQFVVFLGVIGSTLVYSRLLHNYQQHLVDQIDPGQNSNAEFGYPAEQSYFEKSFNQHYIMESLAREKGRTDRSNNPFSICIFDIDCFNAIHEDDDISKTDRILKDFFTRIRGEFRAMDAVNPTGIRRSFARFSNEEYVAILPQTGLRDAQHCAERIREAICQRPFSDGRVLTISAGVAEYQRGEDVSELLARAEKALHSAMQGGGNQVEGHSPEKLRTATVVPFRKHHL
jgi:diguanylate cyclase (GGDEF)-like protein